MFEQLYPAYFFLSKSSCYNWRNPSKNDSLIISFSLGETETLNLYKEIYTK